MKVAVAIIHGMGRDARGFSFDLQRGIAKSFKKLAISHHWNDLIFQEILWADILTPAQETLFHRINKAHNLRFKGLRRFFIEYLGDVIAYSNNVSAFSTDAFRTKILGRFDQLLNMFHKRDDFSVDTPLIVIGHSLGSVILFDYLCSYHKAPLDKHSLQMKLSAIVTLESPLALWSLQTQHFEIPTDIETLLTTPYWLNIYDKDDVIAYPIRTVNRWWEKIVNEDLAINVGGLLSFWNPLSHNGYWKNKTVHHEIAKVIARILVK